MEPYCKVVPFPEYGCRKVTCTYHVKTLVGHRHSMTIREVPIATLLPTVLLVAIDLYFSLMKFLGGVGSFFVVYK